MSYPKPVKPIHLLITSAVLALFFTLLTSYYTLEVGYGYKDYGFPLGWKRIYGGVTAQYNYIFFVVDMIIFTLIIFAVMYASFRYAGWKPS